MIGKDIRNDRKKTEIEYRRIAFHRAAAVSYLHGGQRCDPDGGHRRRRPAEELEGKTVTVRCEKIVDTETTTKYIQRTVIVDGEETEVDDIETTSETLEPAYRVTRDADGNSFDAAPSFLTGKALELMFGTDKARNTSSINTSDIMNRRFIPGNEGSTEVHTLKLAQGASVLTEVKVESIIHSDGRLVCKLTSTAEDEDSDSFSLWLVMNPKVNESTTSETTTFVTPGKPNTETSRTVTAKISTISWTVSSIQREEPQFERREKTDSFAV